MASRYLDLTISQLLTALDKVIKMQMLYQEAQCKPCLRQVQNMSDTCNDASDDEMPGENKETKELVRVTTRSKEVPQHEFINQEILEGWR